MQVGVKGGMQDTGMAEVRKSKRGATASTFEIEESNRRGIHIWGMDQGVCDMMGMGARRLPHAALGQQEWERGKGVETGWKDGGGKEGG